MISIIALLIGILLPALAAARHHARTTQCLTNLRSLQTAHWLYMMDHDNHFITVGLAHGGVHANEDTAWIKILQRYWSDSQDSGLGTEISARSPIDTSPHWPGGTPVTGTQYRRTSYGVNDFLTDLAHQSHRATHLDQVPNPSVTVQFLIMAFEGSFAGSDHVHAESWSSLGNNVNDAAIVAGSQAQIHAYSGEQNSPSASSGYGFIDGHAARHTFADVYQNRFDNRFNPQVAQ